MATKDASNGKSGLLMEDLGYYYMLVNESWKKHKKVQNLLFNTS